MMIKKLSLIIVLLSITSTLNASPSADRVGVCLTFKGDTAISKNVCVVSMTRVMGGHELTELSLFNKKYKIDGTPIFNPEFLDDITKDTDFNDITSYKVNGELAKIYFRDPRFYVKDSLDELSQTSDGYLSCYKTKNLDLCHNN